MSENFRKNKLINLLILGVSISAGISGYSYMRYNHIKKYKKTSLALTLKINALEKKFHPSYNKKSFFFNSHEGKFGGAGASGGF